MMIKKSLFAIFLTILFGLLVVGLVSAQQPTPSDDQVNAIARQLYCPVCENIPLDVCPTTACAQWRELIRQKLAVGWDEQQIKDYFVEQYGVRVINAPSAASRENPLIYLLILVPIGCILGIFAVVVFWYYTGWRVLKRLTKKTDTQLPSNEKPGESDSAQNEYIARLEEEVHKR